MDIPRAKSKLSAVVMDFISKSFYVSRIMVKTQDILRKRMSEPE